MSPDASTAHMRQNVRRALLLVSFLLFPVTFYYLSPYLIIMGAGERTASGSMVVFGVMTLTGLILGRLFCGWLCPAGGLSEALFAVQSRKANNRRNWTRWLVWVPWMAVVILVTLRAGGIERVDVLYQTDHGVSLTTAGGMGPYIVFYAVLALIFVLSLTAGKRGFCHYVCWMAPFTMIGRGVRNSLHLPAVQLRANTPACVGCRTCTTACPMSLEVDTMVLSQQMENSECILCGTCVDVCPHQVIRYDFGRPRPANPVQPEKP
ncbi:MAG: 4Fe-4S binding protein [Caldiserica bacterium]|nr:4Fe-4S binding protein [Caldisericota bacterium]